MHIRNIAIIAHVDHGKTTLVDQLLRQSGTVAAHREMQERAMDSNELERERGITILSKVTTVNWTSDNGEEYRINIVDTPGHADFGGEVERVLRMVDCVFLLVDSREGPMPQTRFVLRKSLALGLRPVVVINKIDRPDARPDAVLDMVFDLFVSLEANEEQLDFPVLYASGISGYAMNELEDEAVDMQPFFRKVVEHVPPPTVDPDAPFCMQVGTIAGDSFLGRLAIGRVYDGGIRTGDRVLINRAQGGETTARINKILGFSGLDRVERKEVGPGEIVMFAGLEDILPGDTVTVPEAPRRLPAIEIDEPTITMRFMVNNSPFAGREGKYVTSRQIRDRLFKELDSDVSLRVEDTETPEAFKVSGRGELHLSVLIERMRREGYELSVSQPRVITREVDGALQEPYEDVVIECEEEYAGTVINKLNMRRGEMVAMENPGDGISRIEYVMPSRGLIGFRNELLTDTRGTGTLNANFREYGPWRGDIPERPNGALIVQENGATTGYSLFSLQERGVLFLGAGAEVYAGQVLGQHSRENDLVVNPCKKKQLTNMRSSGADDKLLLSPPRVMTLEAALEWIDNDELVEVTPENIRIRKVVLDHNMRKRKS
ncbi:MAG: translational GTPase TypA [Deltaproteobacteria bacterium]|nr:MAG: translational GTPase TypA [Deltaproteobacteria bacterium]